MAAKPTPQDRAGSGSTRLTDSKSLSVNRHDSSSLKLKPVLFRLVLKLIKPEFNVFFFLRSVSTMFADEPAGCTSIDRCFAPLYPVGFPNPRSCGDPGLAKRIPSYVMNGRALRKHAVPLFGPSVRRSPTTHASHEANRMWLWNRDRKTLLVSRKMVQIRRSSARPAIDTTPGLSRGIVLHAGQQGSRLPPSPKSRFL